MSERVAIRWSIREPPLPASAVIAEGHAATALARRLLQLTPDLLRALQGVGAPGLLLLVGATERLPWVDGVRYLGRDEQAPRLLLPTERCPDVPPRLLERAVAERFPKAAAPLAFLESGALIPVGAARPLEAAFLERWLAGTP